MIRTIDVVTAVLVVRHQELDADVEQQQAADDLQKRHLQELQCEENQDHAQRHCAEHAPENGLLALRIR